MSKFKIIDFYMFLEAQLRDWVQTNKKLGPNLPGTACFRFLYIDATEGLIVDITQCRLAYREKYFNERVFNENAEALIRQMCLVMKVKAEIMSINDFMLTVTICNENLKAKQRVRIFEGYR